MALADYLTPQGAWSGSPVVNAGSQTGYSLNLKGFTHSITGIVKAGDVFNITGDSKVYRAVSDANSDGSGNLTVALAQPLMASPADSTAIISSNVQFTFAAASDLFEAPVIPGMIYNLAMIVVEDC